MTKTQAKKYLGHVVEACWNDAHSLDPWTPVEDIECLEPLPCRTYGVVVATNDTGVMISASINAATAVGGSWFIPLGMLTKLTTLIGKEGLNL